MPGQNGLRLLTALDRQRAVSIFLQPITLSWVADLTSRVIGQGRTTVGREEAPCSTASIRDGTMRARRHDDDERDCDDDRLTLAPVLAGVLTHVPQTLASPPGIETVLRVARRGARHSRYNSMKMQSHTASTKYQ